LPLQLTLDLFAVATFLDVSCSVPHISKGSVSEQVEEEVRRPRSMGNLRPNNGWIRFGSLGHPCKFQRVSCLGSVTAWHSSSGRQPNFVTLNRRRHLCLAGRPSRWALAHVSSFYLF